MNGRFSIVDQSRNISCLNQIPFLKVQFRIPDPVETDLKVKFSKFVYKRTDTKEESPLVQCNYNSKHEIRKLYEHYYF